MVCALTCVLVTITTTVIHMNRLQTLRQCFYTDETKTCICSSALMDSGNGLEDEGIFRNKFTVPFLYLCIKNMIITGVKCVFEEVSDCGAIHGSLYRCLSAIFGLSVAGVLVCICSAMLAYQLLSHEKKKMYWEQLELRCRSLYRPATGGQQPRPHNQQPQVSRTVFILSLSILLLESNSFDCRFVVNVALNVEQQQPPIGICNKDFGHRVASVTYTLPTPDLGGEYLRGVGFRGRETQINGKKIHHTTGFLPHI